MTRISAVIPTYNRAPLVARAIESALAQTVQPSEILVVDDGSVDDTRRVVERFGPRVRYIYQENAGVSVARNTGVAGAAHEWVAFLDSDDVWLPDYLERVSEAIDATAGRADFYFADLDEEGAEQTVWQRGGLALGSVYEMLDDASPWVMRPLQPMTTQSTVIRRDAYLEVGGQQRGILCRQDTHLFFLLGLRRRACAVNCVGAVLCADAAGARLTGVHSPMSRSYCEDTIQLYRDILNKRKTVARADRRELRRRLAAGYWNRARLELHDKDLVAGIATAGRSLAAAPSVAFERSGHVITRIVGLRRPT